MTSYVVQLKQYNIQSRISPEILEQCSTNLAPEMYITKETVLPTMCHSWLQSLSVKNQISLFPIF